MYNTQECVILYIFLLWTRKYYLSVSVSRSRAFSRDLRGFAFIAEKVSQFQKQKPFRANEDFYDCLAIKTADKTSDKHE